LLDIAGLKSWFGDLLSPERGPAAAVRRSPPLAMGQAAPPDEQANQESAPDLTWPPARLALAERLWGEGFVSPGGPAAVLQLVNPMGLSGADTLLLLGAGPFGAARAIAGTFHCWVEGYERDPELQALALARAEQAGMKKRASTQLLDAAAKFRAKSASHALSLHSITDTAAIGPLLGGLAAAMRPGGQFAMVELVTSGDLDDATGRRWLALEGRRAPPPAATAISAELARLSFDIRIADDISGRHVQEVLTGWAGLLEDVRAERPGRAWARQMVAEAEPWLLRLKLIEAKRLQVVRWQAIRP